MSKGKAYIGLENCKTASNVGSSLRACHCYSAGLLAVSGNRVDKKKPAVTDTSKAYKNGVPLIYCNHILDCQPFDTELIVIDCLDSMHPYSWKKKTLTRFTHPKNCYYVFGAEDKGVSLDVMEKASAVIEIPTNFSMNLAATVNVVLYDRMLKEEINKPQVGGIFGLPADIQLLKDSGVIK